MPQFAAVIYAIFKSGQDELREVNAYGACMQETENTSIRKFLMSKNYGRDLNPVDLPK